MESIIAIATVIVIGTMIPGPSFLMVARTTLQESKVAGLFAALGMGLGSLLLAICGLLGLHVLLSQIPSLYLALKIAGGLYLIYLAYRMWVNSANQLSEANVFNANHASRKSLVMAFLVQISNPKAAIIYGSVFAAFIPRDYGIDFVIAVLTCVFVIETGWYSLVCVMLSTDASRSAYFRARILINRIAGSIMAVLGLRIIFSSR